MLTIGIIALAAALAAIVAYRVYISPFSAMLERADAASRAKASAMRQLRAGRRASALQRIGLVIESILPSLPDKTEQARDKLAAAGMKVTPQAFRAATMLVTAACMLIGGGVAGLLAEGPAAALAGFVLGGLLGWLGTGAYVAGRTAKHRKSVEDTLPSAIDLMNIMIGAGLPLERAFKEIADSSEGVGAAADEFAIVDREINRASVDFCDAMSAMAKRCSSPDVTAFCSALIQSRKQGSGIKPVLEAQAKYARKAHFDAIKRKINKIEVYISIPLGLCFLPAMILLAMAPLFYQLITQLPALL